MTGLPAGSSTSPTLGSNTFWALLVSALTGLPALVAQINLIPELHMPTWVKNSLAVVSVVALWLSPLLVRHSVVTAVQAVDAKADVAHQAVQEVNDRVATVEEKVNS